MADVVIENGEQLEAWLEDKPRLWAQVIALRCALRVVPIIAAADNKDKNSFQKKCTIALFRTLAIASSSIQFKYDVSDRSAANALYAVFAKEIDVYMTVNDSLNYITNAYLAAAYATYVSYQDQYITDAIYAAIHASEIFTNSDEKTHIWQAIQTDVLALEIGENPLSLSDAPIWHKKPTWFPYQYSELVDALLHYSDGFEIWRIWYKRRVYGDTGAFEGFDRKSDEEFYRFLVEQDDDWWKREPALVNGDIKALVDSLRKPKANKTDFFISYAHGDEAIAREVAGVLDQLGKSYVVQYRDFPQSNFVHAMNQGMANAERMIALYSERYMESDHCNAEWAYFYNKNPISDRRLIVPFLLEACDLTPLMQQIVYKDLRLLDGQKRLNALHSWISWGPDKASQATVSQTVTKVMSPQVIIDNDGTLDVVLNADYDRPQYTSEFMNALHELRIMLEQIIEDKNNLARRVKRAIDSYNKEFSDRGAESSWGGLDRLVSIIESGISEMDPREFDPGQMKALEEFIKAHGNCMMALKDTDERMRELSAIPLDTNQASGDDLRTLVDLVKDVFENLREHGKTSNRLDNHVEDVVEQGKDLAHQQPNIEIDYQPLSPKRRYLFYVGGLAIATLHIVGSFASIAGAPWVSQVLNKAQQAVDLFFRFVGI